jgi:hypothetical protein
VGRIDSLNKKDHFRLKKKKKPIPQFVSVSAGQRRSSPDLHSIIILQKIIRFFLFRGMTAAKAQ